MAHRDHDGLGGGTRLAADRLNRLDNLHAPGDGAEHDVLAVEPVGLDSAEEELGAVGVGAGVGHGEDAGALVLELAANPRGVHTSALPHIPITTHAPVASMRGTGTGTGTHKFSSSNLAP